VKRRSLAAVFGARDEAAQIMAWYNTCRKTVRPGRRCISLKNLPRSPIGKSAASCAYRI
jgi:hypothetical protein